MTDKTTIKEMYAIVELILHGSYPVPPNSENGLGSINVMTGEKKIREYQPSDNLEADLKSFLSSKLAESHENRHDKDLNPLPAGSPLRRSGRFMNDSEINAHNQNYDDIDAALQYIRMH